MLECCPRCATQRMVRWAAKERVKGGMRQIRKGGMDGDADEDDAAVEE